MDLNIHVHLHCDAACERVTAILSSQLGGIMSALEDLQTRIAALDGKVDQANAKSDDLIALVGSLRDQIKSLEGMGGATPEQLNALGAQIDASIAKLDEQTQQDQDALGGGAAPAPSPAPAEAPAAGPAPDTSGA